jgi:N-acetylmuramoyl-L-alanine amidase
MWRPDQANTSKPWWPVRLRLVLALALVSLVGWLVAAIHPVAPQRVVSPPDPVTEYAHKETVCLDPGHGGNDPGAQEGMVNERDMNLTVGLRIRSLLRSAGYRVYMTRTTNEVFLYNNGRYNYCNDKQATVLVSIHHNFFDDHSVDYSTVLYYKSQDQRLAANILDEVSASLQLDDHGIDEFEDGVLSRSTMPAALSEAFFMTNSAEYRRLKAGDTTRLDWEADGVARGVLGYFQNRPPKSGRSNSTIITGP